jgi:enoyl-CoA hydratase
VSSSPSEILFDRRGAAGLVTLNRPHALNAVTLGMVRALDSQLDAWRHDAAVTRIVVTAAGGRAFSAGGDLRHIYELGRTGRVAEALGFWREEYALNVAIKRYPKPYVALIDGIVMGGGVGISVHGSHRVAGDRFQFGMPEVGIGFFPDVGATYFLPRLPGEIGTWCALVGERLGAVDGVMAGVATDRVASARFAELANALCDAGPVDAILAAFREPAQAAEYAAEHMVESATPGMARQEAINRLFAQDRVEDILASLDAEAQAHGADAKAGATWAGATAAAIRTKAPLSLKIALAQMRRGRSWSFEECMRAEFRIVSRVAYGEDFYEGIRGVIIDKDNRPRWRPASLAEVSNADVEHHFAPIDGELTLP